nr:oleosin-B6-like [Lolium perenne]
MSSPPPASTSPAGSLPASTTATTSVAAITSPSAPPSTPAVYTPEQMSGVINDLVTAVQGDPAVPDRFPGPPAPMQPPAATTAASAPRLPALPARRCRRLATGLPCRRGRRP